MQHLYYFESTQDELTVFSIVLIYLLTALVVSPFCVCVYVLILPTYPLSLRRN
jgi:hypothetical protein